MAKLFGFKIPDGEDKKSKGVVSPVPPSDEDKSDFYVSSGFMANMLTSRVFIE